MRDRLRRLSERQVFASVLIMTFGVNLALSLYSIARHGFRSQIVFSNSNSLTLVAVESVLGCLIGYVLYVRGWRLRQIGLVVSGRGTLQGLALWLGYSVAVGLLYRALLVLYPAIADYTRQISFSGDLNLLTVAAVCLVNPLFEEALTVGYVTRHLRLEGPVFVVATSTLFRLLAHIYQGPVAVVSILPLGIVFAVIYWRTRSLWPLVVAHVIADFIGQITLSISAGA